MCEDIWEDEIEMVVMCCGEGGEGGRGWQPSVRSVRPGALRAVSPRIVERKWNTLYPWSPAGQLWQGCPSITEYQHLFSPPLLSFLPSSLPLAAACLCVLGEKKIEMRVGAGWQAPTIDCLEIPWSKRNFHLCLSFEYISSPTPRIYLLSHSITMSVCFIDCALNAVQKSQRNPASLFVRESHLSNVPKLHVLCIHLA